MGKFLLPNRRKHLATGCHGDNAFINVLSSDDYQNIKDKQKALQFRAVALANHLHANGGCSYFCTLTYDDAHLPYVNVVHSFISYHAKTHGLNDPSATCPDFNYITDRISVPRLSDVQKFIKLLRKALGPIQLKYILCHEYGHDELYTDHRGRQRRGTSRPHFHFSAFLDRYVDNETFQQLVDSCWCEVVEVLEPRLTKTGKISRHRDGTINYRKTTKRVSRGMTKDLLIAEDDIAAISYVTKYVSKDSSAEDKRHKPKLKGYVLYDSLYCDDDGEIIPKNEICPRCLTSFNLGSHYVYKNKSFDGSPFNFIDETPDENVFLLCQHALICKRDNTSINIPLPRYYFRKFCKDIASYCELPLDTPEDVVNVEKLSSTEYVALTCDDKQFHYKTHTITSNSKFYQSFMDKLDEIQVQRYIAEFKPFLYANNLPDYELPVLHQYIKYRWKLFEFPLPDNTHNICRLCEYYPQYATLEHYCLLFDKLNERNRLEKLVTQSIYDNARKHKSKKPSNPWRNINPNTFNYG